jgi:hypothetical protein
MVIGPSKRVGLKMNSGKAVNVYVHEHVHVNDNVNTAENQLCAPSELSELRAVI